ncbi:unnamed protein product [Musa hybrid cultivar]
MATASLSSRRLVVSILLMAISSVAYATQDEYASMMSSHFMGLHPRAGSRLLAVVKKGDRCDPVTNNICQRVQAKDSRQLLHCCKKHCRNVLSDRNNCGVCGHKCGFGHLCCSGKCTAVAYDVNNCGKCGTACQAELRCEYGSCGYA